MKLHFLILIILLGSFPAIGQNKLQTSKKGKAESSNYDCIHKDKYNFTSRIKNYPFNKTTLIKVVSFEWDIKNEEESVLKNYVNGDTLNTSKIKEIVTLTISQIDTLTDIIYNTFYKGPINQIMTTKCYRPRNGILFYDSLGKIFDFIEICFECEKIGSRSRLFNFGQTCDQKFQILGNFFSTIGIKYGPKSTVITN